MKDEAFLLRFNVRPTSMQFPGRERAAEAAQEAGGGGGAGASGRGGLVY